MKALVSQKGRVTIPKPLRDSMGIRPGEILDFTEVNGKLVARKVFPEDPVDAVYGILKMRGSTDKWITALRGKPDAVLPSRASPRRK